MIDNQEGDDIVEDTPPQTGVSTEEDTGIPSGEGASQDHGVDVAPEAATEASLAENNPSPAGEPAHGVEAATPNEAVSGLGSEAVAADAADVAVVEETSADVEGSPFVLDEWVFSAIEALIFCTPDPLTPARARELIAAELPALDDGEMPEPTLADMKAAFRGLLERWSDPTRSVGLGFRLVEVDGGLSFRTVAHNARYIRRMQMGKPQKLSRAALETLAVVAYRQPVTKPQVEEVRGVDCSGAVKALLDKKLIRILGKAEDVGRPLLYGTTRTFLEFFNLQSLNDLPTLKELHELEHGVGPTNPEDASLVPAAMVMDLFNPGGPGLISEETEAESADALDALERALGEAKKVAKTASTLVFGLEVPDDDNKPASDG